MICLFVYIYLYPAHTVLLKAKRIGIKWPFLQLHIMILSPKQFQNVCLFLCNREDTYYSITIGSKQGSQAKLLSLSFLTPSSTMITSKPYLHSKEGSTDQPLYHQLLFALNFLPFITSLLYSLDFIITERKFCQIAESCSSIEVVFFVHVKCSR